MRYSLLVIGAWSLLWMLGLLASLRVHPHVVSDAGLQLRSGFQFDVHITWDQVADIHLRRSSSGRKLQLEHSDTGTSIALQGTTNVMITFREPVTVRFMDGRHAHVNNIRFFADAPTELVALARAHLDRVARAA